MATEYEVDRMVVRLIGDQKSYQKMLEDVEKQTKESADWAEEQGSRISNAFSKAFKSAQGMISSVGTSFQKVGTASMAGAAAIQAPLGKAALDFSEYGKSIKDMTVETEKSAKKAAEMKKWVLEGTQAFKDLNKFVKLNTEEMQTYRLMSERTGESIEDLTKTIKTNTDAYKVWKGEAEKFGLMLTDEQIKSADDLAESWKRVKEVGKGLWVQIGAAVAPMWKEFNDLIIGSIQWVVKWVNENQELIKTAAKVAEKLLLIGGALTAVGVAISTVSAFLGPLTAVITAGAAAWLAWDTATGKFLQGSALQAWEQYGDTVKKVAAQVIEYGRQIIVYTDKIMTGIFNAVKAGNLELAVEILWSGVKVAWIKSLNEINRLTGEKLGGIFDNLAAGNWKAAMEAATTEIVLIWTKLLQAIDPVLVEIQNTASRVWTTIVNNLDAAMVDVQNTFGAIFAWFEDVAQNVMSKWEGVKTFFAGLAGFIGALWESTFGKMLSVASFFVKSIPSILGNVKDFLEGFLAGLGPGLASTITLPIKAALQAFKSTMGAAPSTGDLMTGLASAGATAAPGAAQAMIAAETAMRNALGGQAEEVTTAQDVERTAAQGRNIRLGQRQAGRTSKAEEEAANRLLELNRRMTEYAEKINELEVKRHELAEQGKADAAERLRIEEEKLRNQLEQAEAEKAKAEADAARARETQAESIRLAEVSEEAKQRTIKQEQYREQYDPIFNYMKRLKELNAAYQESARNSNVYKYALRDLKRELVERSMALEIRVSMTGLSDVRKGTREYEELIKGASRITETAMVEREKLAQVEREQARLNKETVGNLGPVTPEEITATKQKAMEAANAAVGTSSSDLTDEQADAWARAYNQSLREAEEKRPGSTGLTKDQRERLFEVTEKPKPDMSSKTAKDDKALGFFDRIAKAVEKLVEKPTIQTETMEIIA